MANRREDSARESLLGDLFSVRPGRWGRNPPQRSVAGKAELTTSKALCPLEDDTANARRISRMPDPVEDYLRDRSCAL